MTFRSKVWLVGNKDKYVVRFSIGVQTFQIDTGCGFKKDSRWRATWYKEHLTKALKNLSGQNKKEVSSKGHKCAPPL